ncbi:hypothetical protein K2173_001539 [Erythroxylum novogranatense]|uniref:DOG1 domain-containing protein n=1 Tax=Erythroxylum novogranatense TaxID=1862640 RepID=A0AAV8T5E1_9ROSI|nr:hypothetical protein K2173_001539 [Erythroxylum novogranatense]
MFSEIFEKWLYQLDEYLQQLLRVSSQQVSSEQEVQHLVSKVTQHYKEYYTLKWASAHDDVLAFFCPTWISPLEKAYLWITGWKPSMMFKLLESMRTTGFPGRSLTELTQEQLTEIEQLKMKVRSEEEKVEREMERQQVALADRKMVELARLTSQVRNGGDSVGERVEGLVEVALSGLMAGLEKVMKAADCVRLRILKGVLDVLSPLQSLDFLTAFSMLQLQLRHLGKRSYSDVQLLEV